MKKLLTLKLYETPAMEVLEVIVEKGFAQSQGWDNSDWNLGHNDWLN